MSSFYYVFTTLFAASEEFSLRLYSRRTTRCTLVVASWKWSLEPEWGIWSMKQLYEHKFWGPTTSNLADHPNPRLEPSSAVRRGKTIYLLLGDLFDDADAPRNNTATCAYANAIATSESLNHLATTKVFIIR